MLSDWKYPVGALVGSTGMLVLALGWYEGIPWILDGRVDRVRETARADLVSKAELAAANARAAEYRRQVEAGQATLKAAQSRAEAEQRAFAEAEARMEQENATYEAQLAAAGRSCRLSDDDLRWLRQP